MVKDPFPLEGAVDLGASRPPLDDVAAAARAVGRDVSAALGLARELGERLADPGRGGTLERWAALATLGATDLTVARVVEPHLDALAILHERDGLDVPPGSTWGVWAAEGPGLRLTARQCAGGWRLDGRKPWCSLAGAVSHGLVTAWVDEDHRGLFLVDMRAPGVRVEEGSWAPHGLSAVTTTPVTFDDVAAEAVGPPGWYLERPGFAWGGIGVAAVWYGGAVGVARRLVAASRAREPDQVALVHLGAVDAALGAARAVLRDAAREVDAGDVTGGSAALLAARVRSVVHDAAELVLQRAAHGLGPGPLSLEPEHATRVVDLQLYLRQHHAERDEAAQGRLFLDLVGQGAGW